LITSTENINFQIEHTVIVKKLKSVEPIGLQFTLDKW